MGHTYSNLLVHIVFSTKDRAPLISDDFRARLHEYMGGIANTEVGRSIRIGGTENHVHGLLLIRPNISVSDAMVKWKSLSSGWVNKLDDRAGKPHFAWQAGYGAPIQFAQRDTLY